MPWSYGNPLGNAATFGTPHPIETDPSVAPLANAIAALKYKQTQDVQKTLAESIQQMGEERAANAALETAKANPDLMPIGTLGGTGKAGLAAYISMMKANDPGLDAYHRAMADYLNRDKPLAGGGGRGGNKVFDEDSQQWLTPNEVFRQRQTKASVLGQQAKGIESEQEGFGLPADVPSGFGYMKNDDGSLRYAETPEEQAKPDVVSPTDILKYKYDPNQPAKGQEYPPMFTKEAYTQRQTQSTKRQELLKQQKAIQDKMLNAPPDTGTGAGGGIDPARERAIAQAAIDKGAPADGVKQRFKDRTGQDF